MPRENKGSRRTRARILTAIRESPGISIRGLSEATEYNEKTVRYHVRRLIRQKIFVSAEVRSGRMRLYPGHIPPAERRIHATLTEEDLRVVFQHVERLGITLALLSEKTGYPRDKCRRALAALAQHDLVVRLSRQLWAPGENKWAEGRF